ncbi:MAG TPA: T9SS type A sorting domain-containing protein [Panacibacter sp.]|nr:T9SS type A sorting domain-containing protein [Panacibacter sp.]
MKTNLFFKINIMLFILIASTSVLKAQTGVIDSLFGKNGLVLTKILKSRDDISQAIALTPNGKIIVAGNSFNIVGYSDVGIVRYKSSGTIDKTFGTNGVLNVKDAFCNKIAIQPDGKIVMAGDVAVGSQLAFKVWRFTANGGIDSSFGTNGTVTVLPPNGYAICYSVALQPDGKIVVGGYDGSFYASLFVFRLTRNGVLDPTFNGTGYNAVTQSRRSLECHKLLIQPDGKIVAAGSLDTILLTAFYRYYYLSVRFTANGTLDTLFGNKGIVRESANANDGAYGAGLLPDGRIVLSGYSKTGNINKQSALCLDANGKVDVNFGNNGYQYIDYFGSGSFGESVAIQDNGKILLAGNVNNGSYNAIGLARLNSNGTADMTFGNNGRDTFFSVSSSKSLGVNEMILQRDGKILTTGYLQLNKDIFFTARYLNTQQIKTATANSNIIASNVFKASMYPNPVISGQVTLQFNMAYAGKIMIGIYDINGKQMLQPINKTETAGAITENIFIPSSVPNGTYLVTILANNEKKLLKFELMR